MFHNFGYRVVLVLPNAIVNLLKSLEIPLQLTVLLDIAKVRVLLFLVWIPSCNVVFEFPGILMPDAFVFLKTGTLNIQIMVVLIIRDLILNLSLIPFGHYFVHVL